MALSRELLKRLNTDNEPLAKRLKLAENAFCSNDLTIIRKEDLILQWLCKTSTIDESVWKSLKYCLKIDYFNMKSDIKKILINALTEKLNKTTETLLDDVLECCSLLLSNSGMQLYFANNPEELGHLTKSLFNYIYNLYRHIFNMKNYAIEEIDIKLLRGADGSPVAYDTAVNTVESIMQIQRHYACKKDELRKIFICDILYPLCAIIDHKCTDNTNILGATSHKCVQELMFRRRKYVQNEDNKLFVELVSLLTNDAKTRNLEVNLVTFVFIFRAAVETYKSNTMTLDLIFRELINAAGKHRKEIFNAFLKHFNDVTFDFDNKINDITLFDYFQDTIDCILSSDCFTDTDYDLLTGLCYFNPLMIETKVQEILIKLYLQEQTLGYTKLLIGILEASSKLRREQKLVSQLLIALKTCLTLDKKPSAELLVFFPQEFKEKFTQFVSNITNLQVVAILRTLIFHVNTDCVEILQSNTSCKNILMMRAAVELLVAFFEGICIYEYSGTLTSHQKFVSALNDLGNVLTTLIDKALHLNHNKEIIKILLDVILSWSNVQNLLKYYVPRAVTCELPFPILEDHWQQLIQRITNFGEDECKSHMNKLVLHRLKTRLSNKSSIKLNGLIGGLEYFWSSILKFNTEIISFLNNKETSKLAQLLLAHMISSKSNYQEWIEILKKECLQENKKFVLSLLSYVLVRIANTLTGTLNSIITKHVNPDILIETEILNNNKVEPVLILIKEGFLQNERQREEDITSHEIKVYLKILSHIPLIYLSPCTRMLTFLIIYDVTKEYPKNNKIKSLCNGIFADLTERSGMDIFQYIDPVPLITQLSENKFLPKAFEQSLRNISSKKILKNLTESSVDTRESMFILLECMENIKSKLSVDQKKIFKKAERKLSRKIFDTLEEKITSPKEIKILTLLVKIAASNKRITVDLKEIAQSTLRDVFARVDEENEDTIKEGLQLAVTILRNRNTFEVSDATINNIWSIMLKSPCKNLLFPLLESTGPSEFSVLLKLLELQMVGNSTDKSEDILKNSFIIWDAIIKLDMSIKRKKLRMVAIGRLFRIIQTSQLSETFWLNLLQLLQNVLGAKHLHIPENIINMSLDFSLKSLEEVKISACDSVLSLCGILLRMRTSLIIDKLPAFLLLYRNVIKLIVHESKTVNDKFNEHHFKCLAIDMEKLTSFLVKIKKDMVRLSPYLIADLLKLLSGGAMLPSVKDSLQNCISQLISICDQHGIVFLSRVLPITTQEIFKVQLDTFNRYHKFSGKI